MTRWLGASWRAGRCVYAGMLLAACSVGDPASTAAVAAVGVVTLAYAGNVDGEIEPCG